MIHGGDARATFIRSGRLPSTIESFELIQIDCFDVAADTSFAEGQRHPRVKMCDYFRLHFRVLRQIKIQTIGPRVHQYLQPGGARLVLTLNCNRIDKDLHAQIAPNCRFTFGFGGTPN